MSDRPRLQTVNPATGEPGRAWDGHTREEALEIARAAHHANATWRYTSFEERSARMRAAAATLRRRSAEFCALMTAEMGKTATEGAAEIEKCAHACDYVAEHAPAMLARQPVDMSADIPAGATAPQVTKTRAFVCFNPLGVVLAIMPWNFPFWQVIRFAAPNLMAGNGGVLKHASNVPGCAMALEEVFREAGFPADVFRTVLLPSRDVNALIEDDSIAAVTLTGSVDAGRKVAAAAGAALKKTVLELGGSDAYVVLEDADIDAAAKVAATARMVNGGQSCIAGKRFVVVEAVREAFEQALVQQMRGFTMGDPADPATKLPPMESTAARDGVHDQVQRSVAAGARVLLGGEVPDRPGAWYPATVLTDVKPGVAAFDEEVFGPVAAIISARDEDEAVHLANHSPFGLGSGVLTRDLARGERIAAERLNAGMSFVNQNVRSDPRLPFGGVKHSGYGREVAAFGLHEFVNIKSVLVHGD